MLSHTNIFISKIIIAKYLQISNGGLKLKINEYGLTNHIHTPPNLISLQVTSMPFGGDYGTGQVKL